jgi:sulfide:quinone oxidoreductase
VFGHRASAEIRALLDLHGIGFVHAQAVRQQGGRLLLDGGELRTDWAIALPQPVGPQIGGLPVDHDGFLPVDGFGRVQDVAGVFAAGDATTYPVKQRGLATQQADTIAERLAADAGADIEPTPFEPVLRGIHLP